jgi:hypothetical protein
LLCALDGASERVGRTEALAEDTAEVEHEVQGETWVHQAEPLKIALRQDQRLRVFDCDDVR